MKNKYLLLLLLFALLDKVTAQNGDFILGARPAAMAYAQVASSTVWSAFNNPGGLADVETTHAIFSRKHLYGIEGLHATGMAFITHTSLGTSALSLYRFGDELYNESAIALAHSNRFGIGALGVRVNYIQTSIEAFGTRSTVAIDLGGTVQIGKQLNVGALIRNANRAKRSDFHDERLPTILSTGISYQPTEKLTMNLDIEKDIEYDPQLRVGLEYSFLPKFAFRIGVNTQPFINHFGLGFKSWRIVIDYALSVDYRLGNLHQASLAYSFTK